MLIALFDINLAATFSWPLRHRLWFLSHLSHHMSRLLPARQLYKSMPVGFYHTIYNTKKKPNNVPLLFGEINHFSESVFLKKNYYPQKKSGLPYSQNKSPYVMLIVTYDTHNNNNIFHLLLLLCESYVTINVIKHWPLKIYHIV